MNRSTTPRLPATFAAAGLALILAAAALVLAACGGSGQPTDSGSQPETRSAYIVPSSNPISSEDAPSVARYPTGRDNDETSKTGADLDPCDLVSSKQAAAILGSSVHSSLGLQGPTCIYETGGSGPQITVVIEQTSLAGLRREASEATRLQVGNRSGWCIDHGSTSVAVPLEKGGVLRVNGPCALASRFAALAVGGASRS
jgi:hypothetical protein